MNPITRRSLLAGGVVAAGAALTAVGRRLGLVPPDARGPWAAGSTLTYAAHRLFGRHATAREFPKSMVSAKPFANTVAPPTEAFLAHQAANFLTWRLDVQGHVDRPQQFSLADLRAMEVRSQVTEVACEEGWSYIAEWTGTPLAAVLRACGVRPTAKYLVYWSSDPNWWDSIDIDEAMHPQTLMTWGMNGAGLPVPFGGPLRIRVPRQLGYKSVKYIDRLLVTDTVEGLGDGTGGANYASGYSWYAGI